jgi:hypothetical protein
MIEDSPPPGFGRPRSGQYAVIRFGEEWRLLNGEATIGAYPSLDAASEVADKLSRAAAGVGHQVDLTLQTIVGELRTHRVPGGSR